ncbi:MAG: ExbD/TolR family protein [Phycisphaerae bacterium]
MSRRRKQPRRLGRKTAGGIPVDSFSDIAFLLIIYFILATTLVRTQGFSAEMPGGQKAQQETEDKTPTCTLRGSEILWKDKPVSLDQFRAELAGMKLAEKQEQDEKVIILKTVESVPYEQYYRVWAAITRAGGVVSFMEAAEQ